MHWSPQHGISALCLPRGPLAASPLLSGKEHPYMTSDNFGPFRPTYHLPRRRIFLPLLSVGRLQITLTS